MKRFLLIIISIVMLPASTVMAQAIACEPPPTPISYYEQASLISLVAGFSLLIVAIILDKKKVKYTFAGLSVIPFLAWAYVNFIVDYGAIQQYLFKLNVRAEGTLANIAEAQDRFKSEQEKYITDLSQVKSHLAGAHGMDECVEILSLEVGFNQWTATAKHISSPDVIKWDSTSGSSLRKG